MRRDLYSLLVVAGFSVCLTLSYCMYTNDDAGRIGPKSITTLDAQPKTTLMQKQKTISPEYSGVA